MGLGSAQPNYRVFRGPSSARLVAALTNGPEIRPRARKTRGETGFEIVADPGRIRNGKATDGVRGMRPHPGLAR